jgi:hypothetical protein
VLGGVGATPEAGGRGVWADEESRGVCGGVGDAKARLGRGTGMPASRHAKALSASSCLS